MKMTQEEMVEYLIKNINSHRLEVDGNKILGKRLYKSRSFSNFKITFLKSGEVSITAYKGVTLRYDNERDLFNMMGAFTQLAS